MFPFLLNLVRKDRLQTMKHLIIVRHAKSSWEDHTLSDLQRPLNERGEKDAPRMAKHLKERGVHPQQMLSSPAVRAITTCEEFARVLGFPVGQIQSVKALYHAGADTLFGLLRQVKEMKGSGPVILFGHNPGLTDFVNDLLNEEIDNIPTTGVVDATLSIDAWADAIPGCGTLDYFDYPKKK